MERSIEILGYKDKHEVINQETGVYSVTYLMDCMEGISQIPKGLEILAVVDPPYGINLAEWDKETPKKEYFDNLMMISKDQIIWGGNYFADKLTITEAWICWYKKPFLIQQAHFELAWTSFKLKPKLIEYTYAGNAEGIKNIKVDYNKKSIHPAQKPVALYDWIYKNYSKPTDIILDTHLGSQSSRIAADKAGLSFIGFETDPDYFQQGNKRFEDYKKQLKLF